MTITCFEYPSCYFVVLVEVLFFMFVNMSIC